MQYLPRRLLAALGIAALGLVAACSQPQATPTPVRNYNCKEASHVVTLKPGDGYAFFPGYKLQTDIRAIVYKGGQDFVFLDSNENVKRPPEIPTNPDGSVRMKKGIAIRSTAVEPATDKLYRATFTVEGFARGNADIKVREEECTPARKPQSF